MTNVISLPISQKSPQKLPRQRVFYIGFHYVGPPLCQEIQKLYLKRRGIRNGTRWWSIITYARHIDYGSQVYSLELDECKEDELLDLLEQLQIEECVTLDELRYMGWRGSGGYSAEIMSIFDAKQISGVGND